MNFSALFIRRPVMAVLLNLSIVLLGVLGYLYIPVAALPSYDTPVISVSASLPGANPDIMATSVALPLEKQFQTVPGIKTMSSSSSQGSVSITLEFEEGRNMDAAALDVQAALLRAQRSLPQDMTSPPSYRKVNPADSAVLVVSLTSPSISPVELYDYIEHLVVPTLNSVTGVAQVLVYGGKRFAVRIRVKPRELAARNIGWDELGAALRVANVNTPVGALDGPRQTLSLQVNQQLKNAADFSELIISTKAGQPIRLKDVAVVEDSVENLKTWATLGTEPAMTLAIFRQPGANTVKVVDATRAALTRMKAQLPDSITITPVVDRSTSVREALHDVTLTLVGTIVLVVGVMWLFLRRWVATFIPALSVPVSLFGAVALLWSLGYSLDNISLLGLTLAVGLVVDDAIVVVENIIRHLEQGEPPMTAALKGAKEVGFTIVSISISLVAVFIPIFYMPGTMGLLFHEFAVVVGLSILVSAWVSLTLVPMLAAKWMRPHTAQDTPRWGLGRWFEIAFAATLRVYTCVLDAALAWRKTVLLVALGTFAASVWLFASIPKGFFPEEDIGQIQVTLEAAEDTSFKQMLVLQDMAVEIVRASSAVATVNAITGTGSQNNGRMFIALKPRGQRPPIQKVIADLRKQLRSVPGLTAYMRPTQNLQVGGRSSKAQYQYVLQSIDSVLLNQSAQSMLDALKASPLLKDVNSDAQLKGLQLDLKIDRDKANRMGVSMDTIRNALYAALGERQVSTIYTSTDTYQVIMEVTAQDKQDESVVAGIHVRSSNGQLIPLSAMVSIQRMVGPTAIYHMGQLQAITLSFNLEPGVALGEAIKSIDALKTKLSLPPSMLTSYGGDAALYQDSQSGQIMLIVAALAVIYVLLGVLYESYIHPITILAGLPSAAVGGLLTLMCFGMELTLIATIGLVLLIGLVKKNAIMMIDFAVEARQTTPSMTALQAIREACIVRFRPIMMTTLAAMVGALPIAMGLGAGGELRQPLGLVVVGGLVFSQAITLLITPVIYLTLDRWATKVPVPAP